MKKMILAALAITALSVGCSNKKSTTASTVPPVHAAALDVPATPAAPAVSYTPPPQPVMHEPVAQQPVIEEPLADASETSTYTTPARKAPAKSSSRKYTVKKGESLWSIAEDRYGNGNKWKTIAAANPRLDPDRIQAGQTIVLP